MTPPTAMLATEDKSRFHPSSFRDPDCWVASVDQVATRNYSPKGASSLRSFMETDAWRTLVDKGLIEEPLDVSLDGDEPFTTHRRIHTWTYPYEWSQTMLQQAAINHLEVVEIAGRSGWTTKDATSFNLAYDQGSCKFIDFGSFIRREISEPWWAYQDFCEHFLFPLMAGAYLGLSHGKLTQASGGRIPLTEAAKLLRRYPNKPGVLQHVLLPAKVSKEDESVDEGRQIAKTLPGDPHQTTVASLKKIVNKIASNGAESVWADYSDRAHYETSELAEKRRLVGSVVDGLTPKTVIDIGGNDGAFSSVLDSVDNVLVTDFSEDVIDGLFQSNPNKNVLPVVLDICNPTPATGWANRERPSFFERIQPDLILMLAVIHHLTISATVPFREIASWCESTGADIVVEFVTREDEKVQHLLSRKVEGFDYSQESFLEAFEERCFDTEFLGEVSPTRSLWLFKPEKKD